MISFVQRPLRQLHLIAYIMRHLDALDMTMPATKRPSDKTRIVPKHRAAPQREGGGYRDEAVIAAWAKEFDAKLARLTQRQDAFLISLQRRSSQGK